MLNPILACLCHSSFWYNLCARKKYSASLTFITKSENMNYLTYEWNLKLHKLISLISQIF